MNQLIIVVLVTMVTLSQAAPQVADTVRAELCGSLSQQECQTKARSCSSARRTLKLVENPGIVRDCASQSGLSVFDLLAARDPNKGLDEILEAAGARRDQIKAVQTCVFTQLGLVSNGVLDYNTFKQRAIPKIQAGISDPALQSALIGALDTCPQPTLDSMREFRKCIAQTCINNV